MQVTRAIRQFVQKPFQLREAEQIDVSGINTLGIILGPYRNLTTLTAGLLALHPNCQVLNHAGNRILQWKKLNFFRDPSPQVMERFLRFAVLISRDGRRGDYGGSITLSHAFTRETMKNLYRDRYGEKMVKDEIHSLVWKESLRITNLIRNENINIDDLLRRAPGIRFILPVRNPMDTARSNMRTGKTVIFQGLKTDASFQDTLTAVLEELLWFMDMAGGNTDRFFHYFQHSWNRETLTAFCSFLGLSADETWMKSSMDVFRVKGRYTYSPAETEYYRKEVNRLFGNHTDFREKLLCFAGEES